MCDELVSIPNRTEVVILQHPRERHHPIGTARIALLGLERSRLFTWGHKQVGAAEQLEEFRRSLPASTTLLYPDPDAPEASTLTTLPEALLVIDGTWSTAGKMMRYAPWLEELPRVRINPSQPGGYRLRLEPSAECLSTVEAITEALRCLEPETPRLDDLIEVFQRMIARQEPFVRANAQPRWRARPRRTPVVPAELLDDERLVLVGGEYAGTRRAFRWVAHRLGSGDTFDRWIQPPPVANQLVHMGATAAELASAVPIEEAERAWNEFVRPDDVRVAWGERALRMSPGAGGIALKRVYCGIIQGSAGHLSDVVGERLGLVPPRAVVGGRAGERLAALVAVLGWLRQR